MSLLGALDPRPYLMGVAAAAIAGVGGYAAGRIHQGVIDDTEAKVAASQAEARVKAIEDGWNIAAEAAEELHDEELTAVAADRDAALQRLRDRPTIRLSEAATCTSDGAGATGAQLSGPDAAFLVGFAADADRIAADLRDCRTWVETAIRTLK